MENKTPYQIQRLINITYSAFFFFVILVILISSVIVNNYGTITRADKELAEMLKYISFLSFLIHVPLAYIMPQRAIKKIDKELTLKEKLILYHKAVFLRFAILSSAVIFISVIFCIIADTNLVYVAAMGLVFFLIGKPNPFKTASDLGLSDEEKQQLFGGN